MKKNLLKCTFCLLLAITLIVLPSFANDQTMKNQMAMKSQYSTTRFTNIVLFQNSFEISDHGKASVSAYLTARNVDKVKVSTKLQQYKNGSWQTIKSWTQTSSGTYAGLSGTYYVTKGYQYRIVSTGKVYLNQSLVEQTTYTSNPIFY